MTVDLLERPRRSPSGGGAPARIAVTRWAWRMFLREWRRQLLILLLVIVAVAATILGAAVATNSPPLVAGSFGSADWQINLSGSDPQLNADISALKAQFGSVDVIRTKTVATGMVQGTQLRDQNPDGPYGAPMLTLLAGRYPHGAREIALESNLASSLDLKLGDAWQIDGRALRVVGLVQNPADLFDSFALVAPGQVVAPNRVTVLFDADPETAARFGTAHGLTAVSRPSGEGGGISPALVVFAIALIGLIFVGLVASAGFTVLAQRRLRGMGMLSSLGATDRNLRLVIVAGGAVVGGVGALVGAGLGLAVWILYAPHLAAVAGHRIAWTNLPWWLVAAVMVCAIGTTVLAARRPARAVAAVPVVAALSGRPAEVRGPHRAAFPGAVVLMVGLVMLGLSGSSGSSAKIYLSLGGLLACAVGLLLFAPLGVSILGFNARRAPVSVRIALRDLARYRARSGAALAASSFAVFIAMLVILMTTGRFVDPVDYFGPNLADNQIMLYTPTVAQDQPDGTPPGQIQIPAVDPPTPAEQRDTAHTIAVALGTDDILPLDQVDVQLGQLTTSSGLRGGPGNVYVATPTLLSHYGIDPASIDPTALMITSRAGLQGTDNLELTYGNFSPGKDMPGVKNPKIQTINTLPTDTTTPNLLVTQYAVTTLKLKVTPAAWLIQSRQPLTAGQINNARQSAAARNMSVEVKNDAPSLSQVRNDATIIGMLLALGVLAMTVGLIRSETGSELRTLAAAGARATTRRTITAATAGALGVEAAILGTVLAYLATGAFFRNELAERLGNVPVFDLLLILVGIPISAALGGWIFAGRHPANMARQPIE
jgi:putative ABC transport system permease protein